MKWTYIFIGLIIVVGVYAFVDNSGDLRNKLSNLSNSGEITQFKPIFEDFSAYNGTNITLKGKATFKDVNCFYGEKYITSGLVDSEGYVIHFLAKGIRKFKGGETYSMFGEIVPSKRCFILIEK